MVIQIVDPAEGAKQRSAQQLRDFAASLREGGAAQNQAADVQINTALEIEKLKSAQRLQADRSRVAVEEAARARTFTASESAKAIAAAAKAQTKGFVQQKGERVGGEVARGKILERTIEAQAEAATIESGRKTFTRLGTEAVQTKRDISGFKQQKSERLGTEDEQRSRDILLAEQRKELFDLQQKARKEEFGKELEFKEKRAEFDEKLREKELSIQDFSAIINDENTEEKTRALAQERRQKAAIDMEISIGGIVKGMSDSVGITFDANGNIKSDIFAPFLLGIEFRANENRNKAFVALMIAEPIPTSRITALIAAKVYSKSLNLLKATNEFDDSDALLLRDYLDKLRAVK